MSKDERKYEYWEPLFKTKCIKYEDVALLHPIWYDVIDETDTKYLIKFKNGSACWYSKKRFSGKFYERERLKL